MDNLDNIVFRKSFISLKDKNNSFLKFNLIRFKNTVLPHFSLKKDWIKHVRQKLCEIVGKKKVKLFFIFYEFQPNTSIMSYVCWLSFCQPRFRLATWNVTNNRISYVSFCFWSWSWVQMSGSVLWFKEPKHPLVLCFWIWYNMWNSHFFLWLKTVPIKIEMLWGKLVG